MPRTILRSLAGMKQQPELPYQTHLETVVLFLDVSGFTKLSEKLATKKYGAEELAEFLNQYFSQLVRIIYRSGGDVLKFAGDAMIVLWPEATADESLSKLVRRAAACGVQIQENMHSAELADGVTLSVKVGIGAGPVAALPIRASERSGLPARPARSVIEG